MRHLFEPDDQLLNEMLEAGTPWWAMRDILMIQVNARLAQAVDEVAANVRSYLAAH